MTSFEVVTCVGAPIRTFEDRAAAIEFAKSAVHTFPGVQVIRVQRIERRLPVWSEALASEAA